MYRAGLYGYHLIIKNGISKIIMPQHNKSHYMYKSIFNNIIYSKKPKYSLGNKYISLKDIYEKQKVNEIKDQITELTIKENYYTNEIFSLYNAKIQYRRLINAIKYINKENDINILTNHNNYVENLDIDIDTLKKIDFLTLLRYYKGM